MSDDWADRKAAELLDTMARRAQAEACLAAAFRDVRTATLAECVGDLAEDVADGIDQPTKAQLRARLAKLEAVAVAAGTLEAEAWGVVDAIVDIAYMRALRVALDALEET